MLCIMELWRERALVFIIYLIIKIVIIDWSKLNHVTRLKSTYHCLEGLGVLSFDLRSNDSTPKPCDRSSNRDFCTHISLLRHNGCNVVLRYMRTGFALPRRISMQFIVT